MQLRILAQVSPQVYLWRWWLGMEVAREMIAEDRPYPIKRQLRRAIDDNELSNRERSSHPIVSHCNEAGG